MAGLSEILAAVKPAPVPTVEGAKPKIKRKYVQFTETEWASMEASAGARLETSDVKAIIQGVFTGKVALSVPKSK